MEKRQPSWYTQAVGFGVESSPQRPLKPTAILSGGACAVISTAVVVERRRFRRVEIIGAEALFQETGEKTGRVWLRVTPPICVGNNTTVLPNVMPSAFFLTSAMGSEGFGVWRGFSVHAYLVGELGTEILVSTAQARADLHRRRDSWLVKERRETATCSGDPAKALGHSKNIFRVRFSFRIIL